MNQSLKADIRHIHHMPKRRCEWTAMGKEHHDPCPGEEKYFAVPRQWKVYGESGQFNLLQVKRVWHDAVLLSLSGDDTKGKRLLTGNTSSYRGDDARPLYLRRSRTRRHDGLLLLSSTVKDKLRRVGKPLLLAKGDRRDCYSQKLSEVEGQTAEHVPSIGMMS